MFQIIFLISLFQIGLISSEYEFNPPVIEYRLPIDALPESYDITIQTEIHENIFEFNGTVVINFTAINPSPKIVIHKRDLRINFPIRLRKITANPTEFQIQITEDNEINDFLTILMEYPTKTDEKFSMIINYNGTLETNGIGFYRTSYKNNDGKERWIAMTKFDPTYARNAFPCFDEIGIKTKFNLNIIHGSEYSAVSNTPVLDKVTNTDGTVTTTFEETPKMSTMALGFMISDFVPSTQLVGKIKHNIFSRPDTKLATNFALEIGSSMLSHYNKLFDYPLDTTEFNQIAIPMNNSMDPSVNGWNFIGNSEMNLLYLKEKSTVIDEQKIIMSMANEMAQQWFGNLVTPKWWSDDWLRRGFAHLYEYYVTDWKMPSWKLLDTFVYSTIQNALENDIDDTIALTHEEEDPILLFDPVLQDISTKKGASILRMMENAISEKYFKQAVINLIKNNVYKEITEDNLFVEIETILQADKTITPDLNFTNIWKSWTTQRGHPVLNVTRHYDNGTISLAQQRYSNDFYSKRPIAYTQSWWIPLNFASANNSDFSKTSFDYWYPKDQVYYEISPNNGQKSWTKDEWIIFNKKAIGYYRIKYDETNYDLIANELINGDYTKIDVNCRSQIIDDAFEFAKSGFIEYNIAFKLTQYFQHERNYVPWATGLNKLNEISRLLADSEYYRHLENYVASLLNNLLEKIGMDDKPSEEHFNKALRNDAIKWACFLKVDLCLKSTKSALDEIINAAAVSTKNIRVANVNQKHVIYCGGYRSGGKHEQTYFLEQLKTSTDSFERNDIINALGCNANEELLEIILKELIDNNKYFVNINERYSVYESILQNTVNGRDVILKFLKENLAKFHSTYGHENTEKAIKELALYIVNEEQRKEFYKILAVAKDSQYISGPTMLRATGITGMNQKWLEGNQVEIEHWLKENSNSGTMLKITSVVFGIVLLISWLI